MKKQLLFTLILLFLCNLYTIAQWTNSGPDWSGSSKIKQNGSRLYLYGSRLYKSDNNGDTWEVLNTPSVTFKDLLFPAGKIIAATDKGMLVSYNNGTDWVSHNTGITDSTNGFTAFAQLGNRIFVTAPSNVFYSDNNGLSWIGSSSSVGYGAAICVTNGIIIVATNTGIKRSIDNGLTYNASNTGISGTNPVMISIFVYNNEIYSRKYSAVQMNIYKSIDDGLNWQSATVGISGAISSLSELMLTNSKLFFATSTGIFELNTGTGIWTASSLSPSIPYKILHYNTGKYFGLQTTLDLFRTDNNGLSWQINEINVRMSRIDKLSESDNRLFGITNTTRSYVFNEVSNNWSEFTPSSYNFGGTVTTIAGGGPFCIAYGAGNQYYIGTDGGVWSSIDNGATWIQHDTGLPVTGVFNYKTVKDLYVNGNVLVAATSLGIYRSTDQASTWTQVSTLNTADLHKYGSYLYATGNGVYRSNDNGLTWTAFAGGTSGGPFTYVTGAGGKIFTSTDINVIPGNTIYADTMASSFSTMTTNIGGAFGYGDFLFLSKFYINTALSLTTLVDMTDNLPCYYASQALGCIETYLTRNTVFGDNLWLGTNGFSTWYRSLGDFGFPVGVNSTEPKNDHSKVYPNPANDKIYFKDIKSNSSIAIYNNLGQLQQSAMYQSNEGIDVSNLAKGFYFYTITNKENSTSGKFVKE